MLSTWTQTDLPDSDDAGDVPARLAQIFAAVDWRFMQRATDAADRDSKFGAAPVGTPVTLNDGTVYVKTVAGSATWAALNADTGWQGSGWTAQSGFSVDYCTMRTVNNVTEIRALVNRTGADLGPTGSSGTHAGNLAGDPAVILIPSSFRPSSMVAGTISGNFGTWGTRLNSSGMVNLLDGPPGASFETDTSGYLHFVFLKG